MNETSEIKRIGKPQKTQTQKLFGCRSVDVLRFSMSKFVD